MGRNAMTAASLPVAARAAGRAGAGPLLALLGRPAVFGSLIPVVILLNALVGMLLPTLMTPRAFGEYSLVVTLFQYGLIFDLGASQLADRWIPPLLATGRVDEAEAVGQRLLWLRFYVGIAAYAATALVLAALAGFGRLPFGLAAGLLSALAGVLYMVSMGPLCVWRARSARRNYAICCSTLSFGLVVARPGGMVAGGLLGCFGALALWYAAFGGLFHLRMPPRPALRPGLIEAASLTARGVPFFATSFIWAFYLTANRWFASMLIEPEQLGQFAFSANIFALLVGSAAGGSAFYYPRIAERLAAGGPYEVSRRLSGDCIRLVGAMAALMAVGVVLAGPLIGLIYPLYLHGVGAARILLVAVPPLVLASWLMPVSLSGGHRPWIDGVVVYPAATVLLGAAVFGLHRLAGSDGAAWASTVSAVPLVAMQLAVLTHARILRAADAARLFGVTVACCVALAGLVLWGAG
jgi:O-antigen/teichoic acid export membrane protein